MSNLPAVEATKRAVHDTRTRVLLSKTKMTSPAAPVFPHRLSGTGRRPADRSHRFRRARPCHRCRGCRRCPLRDKHRDETQRDTINRLSVYEEQL